MNKQRNLSIKLFSKLLAVQLIAKASKNQFSHKNSLKKIQDNW